VLAALLVAVGSLTAVGMARRVVPQRGTQVLSFLATPFGDMLVFAILVGAGIFLRAKPETHMRLMLVATIGLLDAALSRWPFAILQGSAAAFFIAADLFVVTAMLYDVASRGRIHAAYLWAGRLEVLGRPEER
jgi:hypothetical protein